MTSSSGAQLTSYCCMTVEKYLWEQLSYENQMKRSLSCPDFTPFCFQIEINVKCPVCAPQYFQYPFSHLSCTFNIVFHELHLGILLRQC